MNRLVATSEPVLERAYSSQLERMDPTIRYCAYQLQKQNVVVPDTVPDEIQLRLTNDANVCVNNQTRYDILWLGV